jgi:hypothetical protein
MQKTALILSGGGARGAYQVGVLKGLSEIFKTLKIEVRALLIRLNLRQAPINLKPRSKN